MRALLPLVLPVLGACSPGQDNQARDDIAPAEASAIGSAQSAAEGQAMAEEQVKAAENSSVPAAPAPDPN
jgi:hypothetical protein